MVLFAKAASTDCGWTIPGGPLERGIRIEPVVSNALELSKRGFCRHAAAGPRAPVDAQRRRPDAAPFVRQPIEKCIGGRVGGASRLIRGSMRWTSRRPGNREARPSCACVCRCQAPAAFASMATSTSAHVRSLIGIIVSTPAACTMPRSGPDLIDGLENHVKVCRPGDIGGRKCETVAPSNRS